MINQSNQTIIGKLIYLTITRPGISFAIQHLNLFMAIPKLIHFEGVLKVIKYLKNAPRQGIDLVQKRQHFRIKCI